jgi:myo-inositol 2-dehydrogenase / D-chiro-inositol 1-dehydrogenase
MNTSPQPKVTRRNFLKTSSAATAVAALGALDLSRSAHAAGSDTLRVGLIGCGGRNAGAGAQALRADKGARLTAMCDIFIDRVRNARENIRHACPDQVDVPDDCCFTGFDAYKQVIEHSDVVLIANAAKFHPLHTMSAIQAGKHVFVEKPPAIDPAGLKLLRQACDLAREKGLSVVSGLQSRYHPGYAETVRRIHDGAIGDIVALQEQWLRGPYGVLQRNPAWTELQWQCATQYRFVWLSGDDVVQTLVHNLDRSRWVLKEEAPVKCHGLGGRSSMIGPPYGDVFDHHSVVYEFESGLRVFALCRTTTGCYDEASSVVFGTKGRASITDCRIWGENNWRWSRGNVDPYQIEHDEFFAAIRSNKPIHNDYMIDSTAMCVMGQISCYTGLQVTWEQLAQSNFAYLPAAADCYDGMEAPVHPGPDGSYEVHVPGRTRLL